MLERRTFESLWIVQVERLETLEARKRHPKMFEDDDDEEEVEADESMRDVPLHVKQHEAHMQCNQRKKTHLSRMEEFSSVCSRSVNN